MANSAIEAARRFLAHEGEFRLGELVTESFHPATAALGETAQADLPGAVRLLQSVDRDIPAVADRVLGSAEFAALTGALAATLRGGGRVAVSGCGSTGRLAVLLESAWRAWRRDARAPASLGDRVVSIMTGGDYALIRSVEGFEDYQAVGRRQVREAGLGPGDVLVAVSEGGETSSVIGTVWEAFEAGVQVFFVFNNPAHLLGRLVGRSREVVREPGIVKLDLTTGPMAVCGSTRMQATTIELLIVGAALERALARLVPGERRCAPEAYGRMFGGILAALEADEAVRALADAARLEGETYRAGGLVTYLADAFMADVLTDTTERSPTFTLPPFRQCDDAASPPSWAFLKDPLRPTPEAWRAMLGREPRGLDWGPEVYGALGIPPARRLDGPEIVKFRIGSEDDPERRESPRSALVLVDAADGRPCSARLAERFEELAGGYGRAAALRLGAMPGLAVPLPPSPLRLAAHLALKLSLNTISTVTAAAMGRVRGNAMIYAEATNKKLIDRGTRMVARFTGLSYEQACMELHETLWRQRAERAAGGERRSPVAATIDRLGLRGP